MEQKKNPFLRPEDQETPKVPDMNEQIISQENNTSLEEEPVLENKEEEEKQKKEQEIKKEKQSIDALKEILHKMQIKYFEYLDVNMGFSCPRHYDTEQKYEGKITIRSSELAKAIRAGKQNHARWDASQRVDSKLSSLKPKLKKISKRWWESSDSFGNRKEKLVSKIELLEQQKNDFEKKNEEVYQEANMWTNGIDIPVDENVSDLLKDIFSNNDNFNKILGGKTNSLRDIIRFFSNELGRRERKLNDVSK